MRLSTWMEMQPDFETPGTVVYESLGDYHKMCDELGLVGGIEHNRRAVMDALTLVSKRRRPPAAGMRWMASIDGGKRALKARYQMLYLNDMTISINNSTPYGHIISDDLTLTQLFDKCQHSLQVGGTILRSDKFWADEAKRVGLLVGFRQRHGDKIRSVGEVDNDGKLAHTSPEISLKMHIANATGDWVIDIIDVIQRSNPGQHTLRAWLVLQSDGADSGGDAIDPYHVRSLERLRRSFAAMWIHTMVLWPLLHSIVVGRISPSSYT
jgi:hypothetical protein